MHRECLPEGHKQCPQAIETADAAVKKVFAILGVDIDRPESVEEFRQDLRFGSKLRRAADHGIMAVVASFFVGALALLWVGITEHFKRG